MALNPNPFNNQRHVCSSVFCCRSFKGVRGKVQELQKALPALLFAFLPPAPVRTRCPQPTHTHRALPVRGAGVGGVYRVEALARPRH